MDYLLGIDIGTTGIRSTIIDNEGNLVAKDAISYQHRADRFGFMQEEANLYYEKTKETIRNVFQKGKVNSLRIRGVGISGMAPDALAVDREGNPLYPCIMWMDRRAVEEADIIRRMIGEDVVHRVTGNCVDPYYSIVKMLWIKRNEPEIYRKSAKILNIKDFIVGKLTGSLVTDCSHAGLFGIAYDIRQNRWNKEILKEIGLDISKLPVPYPSETVVGKVTKKMAREMNLVEGIPVVAGMIDSAASYLSCGIVSQGDNVMSLGTSSCWGIFHEDDIFTKNMNITNAPWNHRAFLTNASQATGGAVFNWLRDTFAKNFDSKNGSEDERSLELIEKEAQRVNPGSDGLLILPYFMGERTPLWDPDARGVFFGLTLKHTLGHLYRSVSEGIAFNFFANMLLIKRAGLKFKNEVVVTGGCASSGVLRKTLADVLNLKIMYMEGGERADYADAWLAGKGVGIFSDYKKLKKRRKISDIHEPDPELHAYYQNVYESVYKELYPRLKSLYKKLKEVL